MRPGARGTVRPTNRGPDLLARESRPAGNLRLNEVINGLKFKRRASFVRLASYQDGLVGRCRSLKYAIARYRSAVAFFPFFLSGILSERRFVAERKGAFINALSRVERKNSWNLPFAGENFFRIIADLRFNLLIEGCFRRELV